MYNNYYTYVAVRIIKELFRDKWYWTQLLKVKRKRPFWVINNWKPSIFFLTGYHLGRASPAWLLSLSSVNYGSKYYYTHNILHICFFPNTTARASWISMVFWTLKKKLLYKSIDCCKFTSYLPTYFCWIILFSFMNYCSRIISSKFHQNLCHHHSHHLHILIPRQVFHLNKFIVAIGKIIDVTLLNSIRTIVSTLAFNWITGFYLYVLHKNPSFCCKLQ